ncbi:NAD(P)/FAD-dependent oxidoreductase [Nocardiopsis sp. CC223A]|uniref:dihydrolipoyl dehydrogenase family protein n=1 Tax=Nocardiopsis sp. CC223A TaxID=3044051 RepID=UPI0027959042|nr:FAD-dependent oxidoreductase [Nocardiopsis sp. CC223A]
MSHGLVVIGGGAAGLAAARTAVARGVRPLMVTEGPPGGECTFTGCVPSKTLIEAAARGEDFAAAMGRVRATVASIAATEDESALAGEGIEVLRGRAAFLAPDRIDVGGRILSAPRVVVATGGGPRVPGIPGLAETAPLTTDDVFALTGPPESLVVLGAGPVGCELAQAFARLGVTVTVVEERGRLLPGEAPEASRVIAERFVKEGIAVRTGASVTRVSREAGRCRLEVDGGAPVAAERILVAAGRTPGTHHMGLSEAGVRTDDRGFVRTDDRLATTSPSAVYAAGDVTGRIALTHAAHLMGRTAAANALRRGRGTRLDDSVIPRVAFTDPEVAQVGPTEHEAAARHPGARVAYLPMSEVDRAVTAGRTEGFVEIIAGPRPLLGHAGGGRVLGATIVGERAGELIHEIALAMRTGMFAGRLAQTVHAYPTHAIAVQQAAAQFVMEYAGRRARPARPGEHPT